MQPDNIENKKNEIMRLLDEIKTQSLINRKKSNRYRKLHNFSQAFVNFTNACGLSSLVTTIASLNPITLIVGSGCLSLSTVTHAVSSGMSWNDKHLVCRTTYTQLDDLNRSVRSQLLRNHLASEDYDRILQEINHQWSLINDSSLF